MKTKIKVKTIVQPMYKVYLSSPSKSAWFYCNADSENEALSQAKQAAPSYKIGNCFECTDNWSITLTN
jgi:hypothetical protein